MSQRADNDFNCVLAFMGGWIACMVTVMAWVELTGGW